MIGEKFLHKCINQEIIKDPWPHQIIDNTFSDQVFADLRDQCEKHLHVKTNKLIHIHPADFKDNGINFYDQTVDICEQLLKNSDALHSVYPNYRRYETLGINAHISITPPLPYKFYIHQEGLEKTWSSVTYITPDINVGTKMYEKQDEKTFVKEAEWRPNTTFIFCGQQNKTWHSYESNQTSNRITFNLFIMKYREKKCFYKLA